MSTDAPAFPRGFIFATRPVAAPAGFQPGPLLPNLFVHPWLHVEAASDARKFVIILGLCVSTRTNSTTDVAADLLSSLAESEESFFKHLGSYAGRYAILFGDVADPKVVADATSMRSVFYAKNEPVVSSHALLVQRTIPGRKAPEAFPYQYGYPGNGTPHAGTKLLTPNTYLTVSVSEVTRFWPTSAPSHRDVDSVAVETFDAAVIATRNAALGRRVNSALTAGLDSRVILAVLRRSRTPFRTYTYGTEANTELDRKFAAHLAATFGVSHSLIPRPPTEEPLRTRLRQAYYASHHKRAVPGLMEWYSDPSSLAVSGNLLEIGRSFFRRLRDDGMTAPVSAEAMKNLHYRMMGRSTRDMINRFGFAAWEDIETANFEQYIVDTSFAATRGFLDPFDVFYWEHRMSAWHGTAMLERDFYGEAFIPFNSRDTFEAMLGIDQGERDEAAVFYRMLELADRALLTMPINPDVWPPRRS